MDKSAICILVALSTLVPLGCERKATSPQIRMVQAQGSRFGPTPSLTIAGSLKHRLDLRRFEVVSFTAKDKNGKTLPWTLNPWPDSKVGPIAEVVIDASRAYGAIDCSGIVAYRGVKYTIAAKYKPDPKSERLRILTNPSVVVQQP